jgi:hypothetical protein
MCQRIGEKTPKSVIGKIAQFDPYTLHAPLSSVTTIKFSYLAGMSPYISLKIKKRHYEHHMIEAHKYWLTHGVG